MADILSRSFVAPTRLRPPAAPIPAAARGLAADPAALATARRLAARRSRAVPRLRDDLEGAALLGLALAARDFDPARGVAFLAYARPRIVGAILDELRASSWFARARGEAAPTVGPLDVPAPSGDHPVGWEEESRDAVERLSRCLPPAHGAAVRLRYLDGSAATVGAVGARLGLTLAGASRLLVEAHAMLRDRAGPAPPAPRNGPMTAAERVVLYRIVRDDPTAPLAAIAARFRAEVGRGVSTTTLARARDRLGLAHPPGVEVSR